MLGNLLRRNSPSGNHGFRSVHQNLGGEQYDTSAMMSNSTITTVTEGSTTSGENEEHYRSGDWCNCVEATCGTLPMLDHVSDELKYKLFASKKMNFNPGERKCASYGFRVLVMEELGQMVNRNNHTVVLDYWTGSKSTDYDQIRPNELKEYIFGSPVRSNETYEENKFRRIPNSELVLITRIFHSPATNNRLAVSICVPVEMLSTIPEVWFHVSQWLNECQEVILGILRARCRAKCFYLPEDARTVFPKECRDIVSLLQKKLIPCLKSTSQIPRLFLYPDTFYNFVQTWFKDIFNWIGIKDGLRLNFLPALLAKIICDFQNPTEAENTTRIVIMSGNMVVANKLIFILSGLLEPRYRNKVELKSEDKDLSDTSRNSGEKQDTFKKSSNLFEKIPADLTKSTSTRRPWEIPCNNSTTSVVSVSSDESLAHVIQPSSLKSASSSLHYLSSSLSSQQGSSYGSWFKKRPTVNQLLHGSPSAKINDQWEKMSTGSLRKTSSSTSLHQTFAKHMSAVTPQQSPSISEYDEYPWFGTPNTSKTEASTIHYPKMNLSGATMGEINVDRDIQRLHHTNLLESAFCQICRPEKDFELANIEYEVIPGDSRHAAFMQLDVDYETFNQILPCELLPKYTTYLSNFNRWFNLQAFPVTSESESSVISTMKKDLQLNHGNSNKGINSKTLLVSLRSREIKEITIMKNESHSITSSSHGIVQKTKKIFNNGKCGNVSTRLSNCITFVNASIKRAMDLYDDSELLPSQKEEEIHKIFNSLLHYTRPNIV